MEYSVTGGAKTGTGVAPAQQRSTRVKPPSVSILLLGPSRSGKTTLIDTLCAEVERSGDSTTKPTTLEVTSIFFSINDQEYEIIDTPGFDNPKMSDHKVFTMIAEYLLNEPMIRRGMSGVVFVHREGDPLESGALLRNMQVIHEIFLGTFWYSRLTISITTNEVGTGRSTPIRTAMAHPSSAFTHAIAGGATIVVSDSGPVNFKNLLKSYSAAKRYYLRIQSSYLKDPHIQVGTLIENCLGYTENERVKLRLEAQTTRVHYAHQEELNALRLSLRKSEEAVSQVSERLEQVQLDFTSQRNAEALLQQQLQRTQAEYASLRSQLQLHENVEQSDIVQALKGLNREIDDLGRSISEFLVDNYVRSSTATDPEEVTALHAQHLTELKRLLMHSDGYSSLVVSSTGAGMRIEDFFDYAIRALLCRHLCKRIFYPFHPGADPDYGDVLAEVYDGVRLKEPQATAGKWRVNSFAAVCMHDSPDAAAKDIISTAKKIARDAINPLIAFFFGREAGVTLDDQHYLRLEQIVRTAWEWNLTLKGEVLLLGDFEPTDYQAGSRFNSHLMTEFEATPGEVEPKFILATLALGLDSSRALGGGQSPEVTHVYKAVVATEVLYD